MTTTATVGEQTSGTRIDTFARLAVANIGVAIAAFGIAAAMAIMQALSRANLDLPFRSAGLYYMSVTAHGTLMALVFTTFFIMGFGYVVAQQSLGAALAMRRTAWVSFWIAALGTIAAVVVILAGKATVLYTFYPPLKAHPAFYIGLTLVVVGSWGWALVMLQSTADLAASESRPAHSAGRVRLRRDDHRLAPGHDRRGSRDVVPADPVVARLVRDDRSRAGRMLFWWFGHPLVYFWLLPAYVVWYGLLPAAAGGKLFSEPLGRLVFAMFILLSTPVGFHHQTMDPGVPVYWKLFHAFNTLLILYPSFVTAFTVIASLGDCGSHAGWARACSAGFGGCRGAIPW